VSDDADIALVPLRDRIEHLCKKGWQQETRLLLS